MSHLAIHALCPQVEGLRRLLRSKSFHIFVTFVAVALGCVGKDFAQAPNVLRNQSGLQMSIYSGDHDPAIHVQIPGGSEAERSFNILIPEHVTVRPAGSVDAKHLYIFEPGSAPTTPDWKVSSNSLSYNSDLGPIHFVALATLENDGIRFRYEFENNSDVDYDMVWAVTDPRFKVFFYDPRLERTYVHQRNGFVLLASETPKRLTIPLSQWLPARYHAQFTAPIPVQREQHRDDGITYYYRSETVDIPMIATLSTDGSWVAASFARNPGNVWSNPELTCQHVDPQVTLSKHGKAFYEMKILLFKGSLDEALRKVEIERPELQESGDANNAPLR